MKINKYLLSALAVATATVVAISCSDDDDNNGGTDGPVTGTTDPTDPTDPTDTTDVVSFGEAPSFSQEFMDFNNSVTVITEDTVRYHVANITDGVFTVTMIETATDLIFMDVGPDDRFVTFIPGLGNTGGELRAYADAIGKPLSIIMTHDHFDHWGGMADFADVQVYAHPDVAPLLMAEDNGNNFRNRYPNADSVIAVEGSQEIGGLVFNFDKIQNAETGENSYIYVESLQAVFVADLVYNRAHNYIREYTPLDGTDEIQNWLDGLAVLNEKFGTYSRIFCGHGGSATDIPVVIGLNEEYLTRARNLINGTRELTGGGFASTNNEVVDELIALYPLDAEPFYKVSGSGFARPGAFGPDDLGATWFE